MKLVLHPHVFADPSDYIFFEYTDKFSAEYDLFTLVTNYLKKYPSILNHGDFYQYDSKYYQFVTGSAGFYLNGAHLIYRWFIDIEDLPGKNPLFPPKYPIYSVKYREPVIETLDDYFNARRAGNPAPCARSSILKNSYQLIENNPCAD